MFTSPVHFPGKKIGIRGSFFEVLFSVLFLFGKLKNRRQAFLFVNGDFKVEQALDPIPIFLHDSQGIDTILQRRNIQA
jgi:hypothetical protein